MARPKEEPRIHVDIRILPGTLLKIDKQVRKQDRTMRSRGKVIDAMFTPKKR